MPLSSDENVRFRRTGEYLLTVGPAYSYELYGMLRIRKQDPSTWDWTPGGALAVATTRSDVRAETTVLHLSYSRN